MAAAFPGMHEVTRIALESYGNGVLERLAFFRYSQMVQERTAPQSNPGANACDSMAEGLMVRRNTIVRNSLHADQGENTRVSRSQENLCPRLTSDAAHRPLLTN